MTGWLHWDRCCKFVTMEVMRLRREVMMARCTRASYSNGTRGKKEKRKKERNQTWCTAIGQTRTLERYAGKPWVADDLDRRRGRESAAERM